MIDGGDSLNGGVVYSQGDFVQVLLIGKHEAGITNSHMCACCLF